MPSLEKIVIQDFRNIGLQELEFSPNVNCISGSNGAGKTNLLDAVYYLSMTKSAFSPVDKFNFRHGRKAFAIAGNYLMEDGTHSRFSIQVEDGEEKKLRRDDKPLRKISEHIGSLPIVMVSPSDSSLVSESADERRRFVNAVLSQMDASYLADMQQYLRLLFQRNRLLKSDSPDGMLLDVFDEKMAPLASRIYESRKDFVDTLVPIVQKYYEQISGGRESVSVEYRSDLQKSGLCDILRSHRDRDMALGYTVAGIQRDDFIFTMDSHPVRKCGSQGQQKSFLVALKFAQYDIMKLSYGFPPILLLDDLFDKLDFDRVQNLLRMVSGESFGQIFISDTDSSRMSRLLESITSQYAFLEASDGVFTRQED